MVSILKYITKLVIGNGIELMMRRILLTYFTTSSMNLEDTNDMIDFILNDSENVMSKSMLELLYEEICPLLVTNSVEIFANRAIEQGHYK